METFAGLGYTAGPVIGSVLYEYGGFSGRSRTRPS